MIDYLRDYQIQCKDSVISELSNGSKRTLFVKPTGTGKTQTSLATIDDWPDQDCNVLCLSHREELVWQPFNRWKELTGEYAEIEMGEYHRSSGGSRLTFASKDSLYPARLQKVFPDPKSVGLIWVDEGHHLAKSNKSYTHIVDYFMEANPDCRLFSCTATPDRTDEEALGAMFDSVAFDYPLLDPAGGPSAIDDGWLVDIEQEIVVVEDIDFDLVGKRGGDFIDAQLQQMLIDNKAVEKIAAATMQVAGDQSTVCFTAGVEQAICEATIFNAERNESAYAITSRVPPESPDFVVKSSDKERRKLILQWFNESEFQFITNMAILTEGWDSPNVGVISMGRPTKSRSLYAQCVGRGTRVLPNVIEGKEEDGWWRLSTPEERRAAIEASAKRKVLVLDFVGNSRHSLINVADILGGRYPDEVVDKAKDRLSEGNRDVRKALEDAEEQVRKEELERRRRVTAKAKVSRKKVDPFAVMNVVPTREPGWHKGRKPTPGQRRALEKFRVEPEHISKMSFWEANKMLDKLIQGAKEGKATYRMRKILERHNFYSNVSFEQARATLDQIAASNWTLQGPGSDVEFTE